jgi:hypothetical protein
MSVPPVINPQTWRERVQAEFNAGDGPNLPSGKFPEGRERMMLLSDAQFHADKAMLDEIHTMLRYLCERAAPAATDQ